MTRQGGLQQVPGFKHVTFLKQHNRPLVELAELMIRVLHLPECLIQRLALEGCLTGLVDYRIGMVSRRQRIVAQGAIGIALQFGDVSEIIQRERVVRIEQVGLIEEPLGFFLMPVLEFGNTVAIQFLGGRGYAALWNGNLQIAGEPLACSSEKLHRQQARDRNQPSSPL